MNNLESKQKAVMAWRINPEVNSGLELATQLGVMQKTFKNMDFLFYSLCRAVGLHKDYYSKHNFSVKKQIEAVEEEETEPVKIVLPENIPAEVQAMVIKKGKLYVKREMLKKTLNAIGIINDDAAIKKRKSLGDEIKAITEEIKDIHLLLKDYNSLVDEADSIENAELPKQEAEGIYKLKADAEKVRKAIYQTEKRIAEGKEEHKQKNIDRLAEQQLEYNELLAKIDAFEE